MNRLVAILFLTFLTVPLMVKFSFMADYLVRYEYYQEVLCENQDRPELNCNGKCALAEKLAAQSSPERPEIPSALEYEINSFLLSENSTETFPHFSVQSDDFDGFSFFLSSAHTRVPTPPPQQ